MATRLKAPPAPRLGERVADLPPLDLDPEQVARVGALRAAFDAVRSHPDVLASHERARRLGVDALNEHHKDAASLARRTVTNAARLRGLAAEEDAPPF